MGDLRRTARNLVAIGRPKAERAEYEITFFVEELGASTRAQNELLDLIYRHLAAAGIDLALPPNELWRPAEVAAVRSRTRPERVLELVDVFRPLTAAERTAIAAKLQPRYRSSTHRHRQKRTDRDAPNPARAGSFAGSISVDRAQSWFQDFTSVYMD